MHSDHAGDEIEVYDENEEDWELQLKQRLLKIEMCNKQHIGEVEAQLDQICKQTTSAEADQISDFNDNES